jgi:hypothetical protein
MSVQYTFEIHELSRIGPSSVFQNSPRMPEPKRADRCVELDRNSRSAGGVTIIWIGRLGASPTQNRSSSWPGPPAGQVASICPFPRAASDASGLHYTDAPRTRYHDSPMHLGKAALLSNQFAVHRLEFVRRRLDALRNLVCHPLGDGKQWKGDQTPASRGLRRSPVKTDRLARRGVHQDDAAPAHSPGRQRRRPTRRSWNAASLGGFHATPSPTLGKPVAGR